LRLQQQQQDLRRPGEAPGAVGRPPHPQERAHRGTGTVDELDAQPGADQRAEHLARLWFQSASGAPARSSPGAANDAPRSVSSSVVRLRAWLAVLARAERAHERVVVDQVKMPRARKCAITAAQRCRSRSRATPRTG
jgi:hypothetical protein